jgi:hypothetical protein
LETNARRHASDTAAPEFLACLLRHNYTTDEDENFDTEMLYGADGQLVSQLSPLVRELHFRASLAQVTLTVTGSASAEGFAQNRRCGRIRYDDSESDDSIDEEEFAIDEEDEQEENFRVTKVMNLSGIPIDVNTGLETSDLLNGSMTSQDPDDEVFDKHDRTVSDAINFLLLPLTNCFTISPRRLLEVRSLSLLHLGI